MLNDNEFVESHKSKNTVKKKVWYHWCESVQEKQRVEDISPHELNRLMSHFFISVKKQDGTEYEPNSLTGFQRNIDRHLRDMGKEWSVITDREFEQSQKEKRKELRKLGKGVKKNSEVPLTVEEEQFWTTGQLGDHCPEVLLRTVWYLNTMHFGWRGVDEHRHVLYGDFQIKC